jgi:Cu/Ag efflux protein CusF
MKKLILASLTTAALAAASGLAGVPAGTPHYALGVVQQADRASGAVTLAHEPVPTLKWPAMTMQFKVADPALFERLLAGARVAFEFVAEDSGYRMLNAIPLAQAGGAPSAGGNGHQGMHGGMMGDMSGMREMCMGMMGQLGGGMKR